MLNAILQGGTIHISLHTADPGADGSNEVSGGSYVRKSATFSVATAGSSANTNAVVWTGMPASTITHCGIWRDGTFMAGSPLTSSRTLQNGDGFFFAEAAIQVTVE